MDGRRHQRQPRIDFDGFVAETAEPLLRSAYLITWDFAEAEDLVQECLFKIARRWPRVKKMERPVGVRAHGAHPPCVGRRQAAEPAALRARTRSDRAPRSAPRRRRRAHPSGQRRDEYRPAGSAQTAATAATRRPRPGCFDDLSEAEVADVMGCSVGTVKSTTSRALGRLRRDVEGRGSASDIAADGTREKGVSGPSRPTDLRTAALARGQLDVGAIKQETTQATEGSTTK